MAEEAAAPARPLAVRRADAVARLENDRDLWVATAGADGKPCMTPLSFWWDGARIYFSTFKGNPTSLNIEAGGNARVVLGHTRDVVLIDGRAASLGPAEAHQLCAEQFALKTGWDPRSSKGYRFFCFTPERIESWRELNEHTDRVLMVDGIWIV